MASLQFRLDVRTPERRRIVVAVEVDTSAIPRSNTGDGFEFFVPTWTPGSYLIREYARHLGPVRALDVDRGTELPCRKSSKNRYRVNAAGARRVRLEYWVYAHELTVRTADLTAEHAYWNHACVLLWPVGHRELSAAVAIQTPPRWDLLGGLPVHRVEPGVFALDPADLDTLVDAPMLAGTFVRLEREVRGIRHTLALDGLGTARVHDHFLDHVQRIVEQAADVFGGELPYPHYAFLSLFSESGYGGLEHANSTTLLSPRTAMCRGKSYQEFLGLLAHELFHAWNIKRMRPAELWQYDYENENLTSMLWLAEGWTAYYDDLICRRARVLSADEYLAQIAKNLTNLWAGMGRFRQSLAEASHDAWIRHYRPDENTRNSTQNYYGNGALAALVLDLTIRRATGGERSLDHAIASLYRDTFGAGRGYRFDDVARCLTAAAGEDLEPLLRSLVTGPLDPDFEPLFAAFGIAMETTERDRPYLGFALDSGRTTVASVTDDSPAFAAGIAPGDEILALEGLRVSSDRWPDIVQAVAVVGQPLRVLLATRGNVVERRVTPAPAPRLGIRLTVLRDANAVQQTLRDRWLGVEPAALDGV